MCFVPACVEMLGTILFAPLLLGVSVLEAAIMGSVMAAVSPAVIVPRMIKLMDEEYGTSKSIPQMILAGASVDDVFVIVLFTVFTALGANGEISMISFILSNYLSTLFSSIYFKSSSNHSSKLQSFRFFLICQ